MATSPVAARLIQLATELAAASAADDFRELTAGALLDLIPCDQIFWTRTDFATATAAIEGSPQAVGALLGPALGRHGPSHPSIQSYVSDPTDLTPRRVSDVSSALRWHESAIYQEAFASLGEAHQLSIVTSIALPGTGTGWIFTRMTADFSDREVDLAARLAPMLIVYDHQHARGEAGLPLTPREREVLRHLAAGRTAAAIGRHLGITERTVRKHLGAVYAKLGVADRLLAARRAMELGLIPDRMP